MTQPDGFDFTLDESLAEWTVSKDEWLRAHNKAFDGIAAAAIIFDGRGRVLLVQRAAHDSMPGKWEVPGGAVDDEDRSILHGCVREVREEAGLETRHVRRLITEGGADTWSVFTNRTGTVVMCSFAFEVEVEGVGNVTIDPNEHQDWMWATEEEVRAGGIALSARMVRNRLLEAFRLRREEATAAPS